MNPLNDLQKLVATLREKIVKCQTRQAECLAAAEADGCSADDRAVYLKEFDALQAERQQATDSLGRAEDLIKGHLDPAQASLVFQGGGSSELIANRTAVQIPANQYRPGAGQLRAFAGPDAEANAYRAGMWVLGAMYGNQSALSRFGELGLRLQRNDGTFMATMNTANNAVGGYFVPDVIDYAILRLTEEHGVFRRNARRINMTSDTWRGPRSTGGLTLTWVAGGSAPAQTEPTYDMVELIARNLAGYGKMTVQVNEDSVIDLGDEWSYEAGLANALAEDQAGFMGDGSNTYGGILGLLPALRLAGNAASVVQAAATHNTLPELTNADFDSVIAAYPDFRGAARPKWYMNKAAYYGSMAGLQHAAGGVTPSDIAGMAIKGQGGYPVEFVNVMPAASSFVADFIGILFGDLKLSSMIGDRRRRLFEVGRINDDMIKQLLTLFTASRVGIVNHTIVNPRDTSRPGPVVALKMGTA